MTNNLIQSIIGIVLLIHHPSTKVSVRNVFFCTISVVGQSVRFYELKDHKIIFGRIGNVIFQIMKAKRTGPASL